MFGFWDWVGGRYSMDSAIGLSTMIAIGPDNFRDMLAGFHAMDVHFRTTPFEKNLPMIMGLLSVWYTDFFNAQTVAILPYEQYLKRFPAYLQQLTMESNGKHVTLDGTTSPTKPAPSTGASPAPTASTASISSSTRAHASSPVTSSASTRPSTPLGRHHAILMANVFAQAEALAFGKTAEQVKAEGVAEELIPHKVFEGNRPSNVILSEKLTPKVLGQLVALYEHTVFTQGAVWSIDSFDQWGVELGKVLATKILGQLESPTAPEANHDTSTNALIARYRKNK